MADVIGWYELQWSGGSFEVCFRPGGHFFCPKFQAPSRWKFEEGKVSIDWAKFGKYELAFTAEDKSMDGSAVETGKEPSDKDWRKAKFVKPLSDCETLFFGLGAGTQWDFEWSGGKFEVEFKCDGYNHFKCSQFPAHAHYSLDGNTLKINWAQYGKYICTVDPETKTISGAAEGAADPPKDEEWRKGAYLRDCVDMNTIEQCDGHH